MELLKTWPQVKCQNVIRAPTSSFACNISERTRILKSESILLVSDR
jgi:hypothetical protein